MAAPTIPELYLAFRQAKSALFFERRGVGMIKLAKYEDDLPRRLQRLQAHLDKHQWFDGINVGDVYCTPKRLRGELNSSTGVIDIGGGLGGKQAGGLDIQLRLSPSPDFAIVELLYLRKFGPSLDSLLSPEVLGYRLDVRQGRLDPRRRWIFEFWQRRYQQFRSAPLDAARRVLSEGADTALVLSADLASYYDTVDPSFLTTDEIASRWAEGGASDGADSGEYLTATESLLRAYQRFRAEGARRMGLPMDSGVPIGALTSRVVANLALRTLDSRILGNEAVVCYRRYVDDLAIVAKGLEPSGVDEALGLLLPLVRDGADDPVVGFDCASLNRPGSEFQLQKAKVRVHQLHGIPGREFVDAVSADFDRVVSRARSFLDSTALLRNGARHVVRAGQSEGSPLRALRDADRARLEKFALSTSLHTLERVSALVERKQAQAAIRPTLEHVGHALESDQDWVANLDVGFRLVKLAISVEDWEMYSKLNGQMEQVWGTVDSLRSSVGSLFHRDREVAPDLLRPWVWLRNYLHARRIEAVCSVLPVGFKASELRAWMPGGLRGANTRAGYRRAPESRDHVGKVRLAVLRPRGRPSCSSWRHCGGRRGLDAGRAVQRRRAREAAWPCAVFCRALRHAWRQGLADACGTSVPMHKTALLFRRS